MKRIATWLAVVLVAGCSGRAARDSAAPPRAAPAGSGSQMVRTAGLLIASFDADGDYAVSPPEFSAGLDRAFAEADADGSGGISSFEFSDWRGRAFGDRDALPGPIRYDADRNSVISRAEFAETLSEVADDYRDATGAVPFAAMVSAAPVMASGRGGGGEPGRRLRGPGPAGEGNVQIGPQPGF